MMAQASLIDDILAPGGLTVLFQPIVQVRDGAAELFALEALARGPKGTNVERADILFEYVRRKGREIDVDRACVRAAIEAAAPLVGVPAISINVHAATLERDDDFIAFLSELCATNDIKPSRLILEIVEQQKFWDHTKFFKTLLALRLIGVRIALDDIGLGYSNFRMLIEVNPELYKIDRYFINDCKERSERRAAIESIALLADRLGGRVIAEGIETVADFDTVGSLGIDLMQGFFLARPRHPSAFHPTSSEPHFQFGNNN
jgi:EAL domain-containing protein (putative c-di-GMP-specific phosphodiesterase class I)